MVMKAAAESSQTRTISAAEFKAKCLQLMDEVNEKKLTLIVTKRGKPVMQAIAPAEEEKPFVPLWGRSPHVNVLGDIMAPLDWGDPGKEWDRLMTQEDGSRKGKKGKRR